MEKQKKYLSDILYAISLVDEFLSTTKDFQDYISDLKTKSAVERQLAIIGEAVNKYLKMNEVNTLENSRQIISFRNWLVHSYDTVDDAIVWAIVKKHLPALSKEALNKISNQ